MKDVDNLRVLVTSLPGKYKAAHKLGELGAEKCSVRYECSLTVPQIVAFVNSL